MTGTVVDFRPRRQAIVIRFPFSARILARFGLERGTERNHIDAELRRVDNALKMLERKKASAARRLSPSDEGGTGPLSHLGWCQHGSPRGGRSMTFADDGRGTTILPSRVSGTYIAHRPAASVAVIVCGHAIGFITAVLASLESPVATVAVSILRAV